MNTPIFDVLKLREGFDPLADVEYVILRNYQGTYLREIPYFGRKNEWFKEGPAR